MNKNIIFFLVVVFFAHNFILGQVKASGRVVDENKEPIPFANVILRGTSIGTVSDEKGIFYIEAEKFYPELEVSFLGFEKQIISLNERNFDLVVVLKEDTAVLNEVTIYTGRVKNKDNPAITILKKLWENKRRNGIYLYSQYEFGKYEKIEFDLNNIDEKLMNSRVFKGMEFVFEQVDTSNITGKPYLPIFINESSHKVYGTNTTPKKYNEKLMGNKNSGFQDNQGLIAFIKQLYVEYDIYDNYIKFFDKSFSSPLSRLGPTVYNYVLRDSAFIDSKWCYNIVFYPRRQNELTFKGDFWVNDTTFAIKEIEMYANKTADVNWVKEIYIEQEFEVLNDSVFLLKRDHFMSDFALRTNDKSKGVYGRRTTLYDNHIFNVKRPEEFYKKEVIESEEIYQRPDEFWAENRMEKLSGDEQGIYQMLDTLKTVKRFRDLNSAAEILTSGYWQITDGFDWGPIYSTIGLNEVEGFRLRFGGRTYFSKSDMWRLQGYIAYGFGDQKFKYGLEGKWLIEKNNRIVVSLGNRSDIEQLGVSLTTSNDVLDKSFASTSLFTSGSNSYLSNVNISNGKISAEPLKNFQFMLGGTYKLLESADQDLFNADYIDENGNIQSHINQSEANIAIQYTPGRNPWGMGVDQGVSNEGRFPTMYFSYTKGIKGIFNSDFDYHKLQFYYEQPFQIGLLGRTKAYFEIGKTINTVPLLLLNIVPGNQTYFIGQRIFDLLDYYEFVTDEYISMHFEHNFNGKLFSKIPALRKLQWRELVGIRGVVGNISEENIAINASEITYVAPEKLYWEYHVGVGNIFKLIRIDLVYRGNYKDIPGVTKFAVKGGLGFYF